ncbi:MAG: sensor domain-containing protein [Anaerolineales bacterium]|nr:sensor domain-containing protein [Anaerolineales bacterium]
MKKFFPNLIYLLLSLPLGVLYFVILITGFSLGAGLAITLVGIPILVAMIFVTYILGDLDRTLTSKLLGVKIGKPEARPSNSDSARSILVAQLKSLQFWKELVYLLLKMPLGVISFTIAVVFVSVSLAFILAPFILTYVPDAQMMLWNGFEIDTMQRAIMTSVLGVILSIVSIVFINGFANLMGSISVWVLGKEE